MDSVKLFFYTIFLYFIDQTINQFIKKIEHNS